MKDSQIRSVDSLIMDEKNHEKIATLCFNNYFYKWINENTNQLVLICNEQGKVIFSSNAFNSRLGYTSEELKETSWHRLLSTDNIKSIKELTINRNMDSNEVKLHLNVRSQWNEYVLFQCKVARLHVDESDNYLYFITLNNSESELEYPQKNSNYITIDNHLAAGIAHEIRNPLTSIKGFLQLMNSGVRNKETYYNIMIEEIDKLEAITSELLFVSKPLTNQLKIENVSSMIQDVMILLTSQAKLKGITIKKDILDDVSIKCDRSQMKQVLLNIIKNAIEAMDHSGTVTITTQMINHMVEINIIDEGKGIPKELLHKINEPFFTSKKDGTGLGLMISKKIIEAHDGELHIIRNENKGCTFRILLPFDK